MGTSYAWNMVYSKILPAKSPAWCHCPAAAGPRSQGEHRNLATDPKFKGRMRHLIMLIGTNKPQY